MRATFCPANDTASKQDIPLPHVSIPLDGSSLALRFTSVDEDPVRWPPISFRGSRAAPTEARPSLINSRTIDGRVITLVTQRITGMPTEEDLKKGFTIGEWTVLPARGELCKGDRVVVPEPMVMKVLLSLAMRNGDVVTKEELIDEVWNGRVTSDDTIVQKASQLRGYLDDKQKPYRYVETLTKVGYRLKQEVHLLEVPGEESEPAPRKRRNGSRSLLLGAAAVVAAIVVYIIWPARFGSIGVLPFENQTGSAANQYLVSGFKETLIQTLHEIPDFSPIPGRDTYDGIEVPAIAAILDVESVLFGVVQLNGNTLKINYHVARGSDGVSVSSGSITGPRDESFRLQAELAVILRNDLVGKSSRQLEFSNQPASSAAFDTYMRGLHAFERRGPPGKIEEAIDLFKKTIDLDPQFGPAYLSLAMLYVLLPDQRDQRVWQLEETHALAISIVEQGIAVDESIRDAANAIFGFVYQKQRKWGLAEQAYIRASSAQAIESTAFHWHSLMLANVGRLDDALQKALAAQRIDPSNAVVNSRVAEAYAWLNDVENAAEFFERTGQLGGGDTSYLLTHALWLQRQGRVDEAQKVLGDAVSIMGDGSKWFELVFAALADTTQRESGLAAIDRAAADAAINLRVEVYLRTQLGDIDGAIRVASGLTRQGETLGTDFLFLPELLPVRQHADFLALMEDLDIAAYWEEAGCVFQDAAVHCPEPR